MIPNFEVLFRGEIIRFIRGRSRDLILVGIENLDNIRGNRLVFINFSGDRV